MPRVRQVQCTRVPPQEGCLEVEVEVEVADHLIDEIGPTRLFLSASALSSVHFSRNYAIAASSANPTPALLSYLPTPSRLLGLFALRLQLARLANTTPPTSTAFNF